MKELKDLVAGDNVLVVGVSCRRIAKIDKVTKTQIVVNNRKMIEFYKRMIQCHENRIKKRREI